MPKKRDLCRIRFMMVLFFFLPLAVNAFENTFYILRDDQVTQLMVINHHKINVLIPQAYKIDENGKVTGHLNDKIYEFARERDITIMPLVTNVGFNKFKAHQFLANSQAVKNAIEIIVGLCQKHHFYGIQFDFEGVGMQDRTLLTRFYVQAARALHEKNYKVSYAVVAITDSSLQTEFEKRQYALWSGAYDYAALAKHGDFISLMSYDQHSQGTTPGPTANIRWVESTIRYALRFVPKEKLSLGIPVYSGYWHTAHKNGHIKVLLADKTYAEVQALLVKHHAKLIWDDVNKINYAFYNHHWLNVYIYAENARSFEAKLKLARDYDLRGISVFNLGCEDPAIWQTLQSKRKKNHESNPKNHHNIAVPA